MKNKLRIFIDMDGVLANFKKAADLIPDEEDKKHPDLVLDFSTFDIMIGAREAVTKLLDMGHDLFIASICRRACDVPSTAVRAAVVVVHVFNFPVRLK